MPKYIQCDQSLNQKIGPGPVAIVLALLGVFITAELALTSMEITARQTGRQENQPAQTGQPVKTAKAAPEAQFALGKKDLAKLIGSRSLAGGQEFLEIKDAKGRPLLVRTTLEPELQTLGQAWVKGTRAKQAALVIMNPDNGEVLTLSGYQAEGQGNAALAGSFPAASLFKIVTAAAAVEKAKLSAGSKLLYDGGQHTLYKANLAKDTDKGNHSATLEESFAKSINIVFGKLGVFTLGPEGLTDYAKRFGFNRDISFEMPVEKSRFSAADADDFHLAELASGFNRVTKVSPLHGAMLAGTVASGGRLHEPRLVREVIGQDHQVYYQARATAPKTVVSAATARELAKMMRSTVEEGTGRRVLGAAAKEHPVLSQLIIGGKSGSLNNEKGQKVDWFVAWAQPKPGSGCRDRLALSAVIVHDGLTTTTSQQMIRKALTAYYRTRLTPAKKVTTAQSAKPAAKTSKSSAKPAAKKTVPPAKPTKSQARSAGSAG